MISSFLERYSTWAGTYYLPKDLVAYFLKKYKLSNLDDCIFVWAFEDFNVYVSKVTTLNTLVKTRFRRLNPVLSTMGFLTLNQIVTLWVVEHVEKDLHVKNKVYEKPNSFKETILSCIEQGITYSEISEYYLTKRFTTEK